MSQENVEVLRRAYDAFNRRDWNEVFSYAVPEFELTTQLGPDAGIRRGREQVTAFAEQAIDTFDRFRWEPEEFFEGQDQVVVFVSVHARPRGGSIDLVVRNGHLWTLRERLLVSMKSYPKPADALEAAGLTE